MSENISRQNTFDASLRESRFSDGAVDGTAFSVLVERPANSDFLIADYVNFLEYFFTRGSLGTGSDGAVRSTWFEPGYPTGPTAIFGEVAAGDLALDPTSSQIVGGSLDRITAHAGSREQGTLVFSNGEAALQTLLVAAMAESVDADAFERFLTQRVSWNFGVSDEDDGAESARTTGDVLVYPDAAAQALVPFDLAVGSLNDGFPFRFGVPVDATLTVRDDVFFGTAGDDIIHGWDGNDHIYGGDGDDRISGGRGDDVFYASAGNDAYGFHVDTADRPGGDATTLTGEPGYDVLKYDGDRGDFGISSNMFSRNIVAANYFNETQAVIAKPDGSEDTVYVQEHVYSVGYFSERYAFVDEIGFDDGSLIFDVTGDYSDFTYALYAAALTRTPDQDGFRFWNDVMNSPRFEGLDADGRKEAELALARAFVEAPEFTERFDVSTDARFVDALYENVLGRAADQGGFDFWLDVFANGGERREGMLRSFSTSEENIASIAADIDLGYWVV